MKTHCMEGSSVAEKIGAIILEQGILGPAKPSLGHEVKINNR
jgi:hypothetical protein